MQITIDSREPLDDVLRVIGSLYDVTLTRTGTPNDDGRSSAGPRSGRGRSTGKPTRANKAARQGSGERPADAGVVRQWATSQGMSVSARGALPKNVRDAYAAAHA